MFQTEHKTPMMTEDVFLQHYGVLGMKWGVRKKRKKSTVRTSADAARTNKIKARVKKNGLNNLSNDDLAKLNKRSELVTAYKKNNPKKIKKGADATKDVLAIIGTGVAAAVVLKKASNLPIVKSGAEYVKTIVSAAVFNQ
jgi:hypothetical protein